MYILEEELKNYHEHYEEDLNAYGYYLTENTENKQVFEHESNKSEIIITLKGLKFNSFRPFILPFRFL